MAHSRILTIAGSDPSGGAGIQGDLRTFTVHGCYGMAVLTALTVQNTLGVREILYLERDFVVSQLRAVLDDIGTEAVKTGMLGDADTVRAICEVLAKARVKNLVVDPVMVAKGGHPLMLEETVSALKDSLFPLADLVTPNLDEVLKLTGEEPTTAEEMEEAARAIGALGCRAVLVKGGHLQGGVAIDVLWDGSKMSRLEMPRLDSKHTHGTGCALSAAISSNMGKGMGLKEAVLKGKQFVYTSIQRSYALGKGIGPMNSLWSIE